MSLKFATRAFLQISTSSLQETNMLLKFLAQSCRALNQKYDLQNLQNVDELMFMFNRISTSKEIKLIFRLKLGRVGLFNSFEFEFATLYHICDRWHLSRPHSNSYVSKICENHFTRYFSRAASETRKGKEKQNKYNKELIF